MKDISREERIKLMLVLAESVPSAQSLFAKLYRVILKYDLPKHVDREFVYDCLVAYFSLHEDYVCCAELMKCKKDSQRYLNIEFNYGELTRADLKDLKLLGYSIPDNITLQVWAKTMPQ